MNIIDRIICLKRYSSLCASAHDKMSFHGRMKSQNLEQPNPVDDTTGARDTLN
jgi:hypothetical protein